MDDETCMFLATLDGGTCAEYCAARGGACVGAYHDFEDSCEVLDKSTCDEPVADNLCVCRRTAPVEPTPATYEVRLLWGQKKFNPDHAGTMVPWDGGMWLSDGYFSAVNALAFEAGGEYENGGDGELVLDAPTGEIFGVKWRSSTTVHRDGVKAMFTIKDSGPPYSLHLTTMAQDVVVELEQVQKSETTWIVNTLGDAPYLKIERVKSEAVQP